MDILFKRLNEDISFKELKERMNYYAKRDSYLDEVSWNDLGMNEIYAQMEETLTTQGDEALYHSLHEPIFEESQRKARAEKIQYFQTHSKERDEIRNSLQKNGRLRYDFRRSIAEDFQVSGLERVLYLILPLALITLVIIAILFQEGNLLIPAFLCVLFSGSLHFKFVHQFAPQIDTLLYTYKLLNFCKVSLNKEYLRGYELGTYYKQVQKTHHDISFFFMMDTLNFLAEYLNILFLIKERRYLKISKKIQRVQEPLFKLYEIVGQIDMHQGVSLFLEKEKDRICRPIFLPSNQKVISFEGLIHPGLKEPVSNSLHLDSCAVITGSNMSGKSTFLRTVGVNVVLAQTWEFVYAKSFSLCPMHIITSISLQDNIQEGKSYFFQEADAIRRMLINADRKDTTLFLIDEIFKGTNPIERIASATEICLKLADSNTIGLVATHDLQLLPQIPCYIPYYFTENVTKEDLSFDYKIRPGIAGTRNAVKILEYLNYDASLIEKIHQRIAQMESKK